MIRVRRSPVAIFASAFLSLFLYIPQTNIVCAQTATEEKPAAEDSFLILTSSEFSPAEPVKENERNERAGFVYSVRFSPDGKTLATGWGDGAIRIWDVTTRKNTGVFVTPKIGEEYVLIRSVAFSPDGKTIASGNSGTQSFGVIRLWDLASGKNIAAFNEKVNGHIPSGPYCVVYNPDGKTLATGHEDNVIRVWDTASHRLVNAFHADDDDAGYAVAFSPDGKTLASGGPGGTITLWDMIHGEKKSTLNAGGAGIPVYTLAYHPDAKTLIAGCSLNGSMLWDIAKGTNTAQFKPDRVYSEVMKNINDMTYSVAFSPDGRTFAQGCHNGLIVLWDVSSRAMTALLYGHTDLVSTLDFSPDGNTLISGGKDGTVRLWDLKEP